MNFFVSKQWVLKYTYWGEKTLQWPKDVTIFIFSENVWFSTFTKLMLKNVFTNYIQNMVVQLPNNVIFKRKIIIIDIKWLNNTLMKN